MPTAWHCVGIQAWQVLLFAIASLFIYSKCVLSFASEQSTYLRAKKDSSCIKKCDPLGLVFLWKVLLKNLDNVLHYLRFFASLSYHKNTKRNYQIEVLAKPSPERCFCLKHEVLKGKNREGRPVGKIRQNFYRRANPNCFASVRFMTEWQTSKLF